MNFNMSGKNLRITGFVWLSIMLLAVNVSYSADLPAKNPNNWNKIVEAARKEGRVVIYSSLASEPRQVVSKAFLNKYGIEVETLSGQGSGQVIKVETERLAGIYSGDLIMDGAGGHQQFKDKGFLESMDHILMLPEVRDPKQWMYGSLPFVDNAHMMISYFIHAGSSVVINTELVKEDEIKSYNDLLAPKWKGKIVMQDPTISGAGSLFFTINIMEIMGKDFAYKLASQEPIISKDRRLALEWVARGKYPVILAPDTSLLGEFSKTGLPLKHVIPHEGTYCGGGSGGVSLLNKAPHPNAAMVFINWLLSKEGQTIMAKAQPDQSRRLDVPIDFIAVDRRMDPNVKYINSDVEKYVKIRMEMMKLAKEIFGL